MYHDKGPAPNNEQRELGRTTNVQTYRKHLKTPTVLQMEAAEHDANFEIGCPMGFITSRHTPLHLNNAPIMVEIIYLMIPFVHNITENQNHEGG